MSTSSPSNDNSLNDKVYLCPTCGSAAVNAATILAGGASLCKKCGWEGKLEDLAVVPFGHDFESPEKMLHALALDLRGVMAGGFAVELGRVLVKWGFMSELTSDNKEDKIRAVKALSRYIGASANAIAATWLTERMKMETEQK